MFWLLMALKDDLFPERIWNVLFSFESGLRIHTANISEPSAQNNPSHWLNYHAGNSSHNIIDFTVEIVRATVIQHPPF